MRTSNRDLFVPLAPLAPLAIVLAALLLLPACGNHRTLRERSTEAGQTFEPGDAVEGLASWYGPGFAGRKTASGEVYDPRDLTAAHRTLPFGTRVLVRNLDNGRTCWVRVNDRGPFVDSRIIDLSYTAAEALGVVGPGTARVALDLAARAPVEDGAVVRPATVVALPPVATEAPSDEPGPAELPAISEDLADARPWSVQVGAFALAENAQRLAQDLARRGLDSRVVVLGSLARVRIGAWTTPEAAQEAAESLRRDGFETTVVREDDSATPASVASSR